MVLAVHPELEPAIAPRPELDVVAEPRPAIVARLEEEPAGGGGAVAATGELGRRARGRLRRAQSAGPRPVLEDRGVGVDDGHGVWASAASAPDRGASSGRSCRRGS